METSGKWIYNLREINIKYTYQNVAEALKKITFHSRMDFWDLMLMFF
jgi:hypothetical protein